jgi:type I restriction enzyme S subunit
MLQSNPASPQDRLLPYLRSANVMWGDVDVSDIKEMFFSPTEARQYQLEDGDVVVCEGGDVGRAAIWRAQLPEVCIQNAVHRVRTKGASLNRFLYYWLFMAKESGIVDVIVDKATIGHLTEEKLREVPFFCPPRTEQSQIVDFLDRETAKVDALISKREVLIALLEEKRTALINRAVTKGLDPSVPTKDSGINWLGKIPAHWLTPPLYARYEVQLGKMLDSKRITGTRLASYLRNVDVQWDSICIEDLPKMDFSESDRERFALRRGDLLVCEGGEVGRTAVWHGELEECYYQKAIHRLRPKNGEDLPRYLFYVMYAASKLGVFQATGNPNTIDHLTAEKLRAHRFPFPPSHEQSDIVAFLDRRVSEIQKLQLKCHESIGKLQEFRTALISAAVTGKIDVRGEVQ